jgi:Tfp pilus assembly PilM family ATPase
MKSFREVSGDLSKKGNYVEALKELKGLMGISSGDPVAVSINGKQVHVVQLPFKKLPDSEMKNALRFEIRQNLPFESGNAVINYQWISDSEVLAVVVGGTLFHHQIESFQDANLNLQLMDVLPLTMANSFWARKMDLQPTVAHVCLHFGEESCILVVDGQSVPFYTRSILFRASKLVVKDQESLAPAEISGSLEQLGSELRRSLNFYEKNHDSKGFGKLILSGQNCSDPSLRNTLQTNVALPFEELSMKKMVNNCKDLPDFEYDVALTLAIRGMGK